MSIHTIEHCRIADETEKIAYECGAEDMRKALCTIRKSEVDGGMPPEDVEEIFGTIYCTLIITNNSALDIITKVKQWEKEKREEIKFKIGDEIECVNPYYTNYGKKYVVVEVSTTAGEKQDYMRMISLSTLMCSDTLHKEFYRKTGKHYDSIPIPKEGENK